MNCANHPEIPAVAYCQYCGKPLCNQCIHKVNNIVSCEPCLAARVHAATTGAYAGRYSQGAASTGPLSPGTVQPPANWGTEAWIAIATGWIPGVGAVYNGQIAKALVHVVVFALLIDLTHYNGLIGLLIPIWILYQWFDAYQTTVARRDGLPLPNPLGLNDVGRWFGARGHVPYPGWNASNPNAGVPGTASDNPGSPTPGAVPPPPGAGTGWESAPAPGFASGYGAQPYAPYPPPPIPPIPAVPPAQYDTTMWCSRGRGIPIGALILIILGVAFLLGNLGVFSDYWMERSWPIILIAIGVWLVVRRSQTPPGMPPPGGVR